MDTPSTDRRIVLTNVMQFLDRESASVLSTISHDYDVVTEEYKDNILLDKRRVEAEINESLDMPGSIGHDWSRTYTILQEHPKVLLYTGSEIDAYIAGKLGEKKLPALAMLESMEHYAERGYVTSFAIVMEYYGSRDKIKPVHYLTFTLAAVKNNKVGILDSDKIRAYMERMSADDIEEVFQEISESGHSPRTVDFFLSNVRQLSAADVTMLGSYVCDLIIHGDLSLVRVFLKHGMVRLPASVEEELADERVDLDMDYGGCSWNPVYLAAKHGRADILRLLLQEEVVQEIEVFWFNIRAAVRSGHTEVVRIMLEDGRIDLQSEPYLPTAVRLGWLEIVKLLVTAYTKDRGEDSQHEWFPLISSGVNNDRADIVRLLLSAPNLAPLSRQERGELIATAKYNGNVEIERILRLHE